MMEEYITRPEFEQYSQRVDDENHRQNKRIDALENSVEKITDLTLAVNRMAVNMEQMVSEQKAVSDRLKAIEDEPKETMKTVRASVLSAIGGAVGMAIIAGIIAFIQI